MSVSNGFGFLCLAAAFALCGAATARACDRPVETTGFDRAPVYDPFVASDTVVTLRVAVPDDCAGTLFLRRDTLENLIGGAVRYEILVRDRRIEPGESAGMRDVPLAEVKPGERTVDIRFRLPAGQTVLPGRYFEPLVLRLDDAPAIAVPRLDVTVPERAGISIIGLSPRAMTRFPDSPVRDYTLDFGALETGEAHSVYLQLRSNGPYELAVSSAQGGALVHAKDAARIDYSVFLDGSALELETENGLDGMPTGLAGRQHALRFRIGEVGGKPAGAYEDEITLTVRSRP